MSWGSTVKFTIEAAFKRDISDVSTWSGTAQDNLTKVGDTVKFPGRQPPRFYFGDGTVERAMTMTVTALSVAENWVMGTCTTVHEYSTPNNKGQPWYAHFTGCCRHSRLVNNKDAEWVITAAVDLNLACVAERSVSNRSKRNHSSLAQVLFRCSFSSNTNTPRCLTRKSPPWSWTTAPVCARPVSPVMTHLAQSSVSLHLHQGHVSRRDHAEAANT